jgi:hypothetical protein
MNMKKLPFGTSFSSASADDKQVSAMWAMEVSGRGPFCNLTPKRPRSISMTCWKTPRAKTVRGHPDKTVGFA